MDVHNVLDSLRKLAQAVTDGNLSPDDQLSAGEELAEKFIALDEWLSKGGFKPIDWVRNY